jgi:hypothetical protein
LWAAQPIFISCPQKLYKGIDIIRSSDQARVDPGKTLGVILPRRKNLLETASFFSEVLRYL